MEFRKNDILTLDIEDCGVDGEGIGKADGFTVFVKDAVIGDRISAKIIKAKKNYGYGRLMEVITPSPYRVKPACSIARQCGGCQLQALSYEQQLKFKEKKVRGHLERIGGFKDFPMETIMGMDEPYHYRNKAQFPVGKNKDGKIITGFYAGRTHSIIDNRDCILGVKQNKDVLDRVIGHMEKYHVQPYDETTGKGLVRHIMIRYGFHTDEMMVCLILNGDKIPAEKALVDSLCEIPEMTSITINVNKKRNNVILGDQLRLLWGQSYIRTVSEISPIRSRRCPFSRSIPSRPKNCTERPWSTQVSPEMKQSGICTVESEPSLPSSPGKPEKSAVSRSFRQRSRMPERMRSATVSIM